MIRVLLLISFFLLTLQARENPFFPAQGGEDVLYTPSQTKTSPPLKRSSITLPSSARAIKKVTIEYENLDASIDEKSIVLNNSIDWHLPIFISQSYSQTKTATTIKADRRSQSKTKYKKIAAVKYVSFYSAQKTLKIVTNDTIIRNFLLVEPHRIVLDFKRDTNLRSYSKENPKDIFCKIRVGNHAGYYRAVVELDGLYRYKMQKVSNGYILTLR